MERVEMMYRELSSKIFKMNNFLGLGQLFLNQSFYDSSLLEKQVRKVKNTEKMMYETMSDLECPKVRETKYHNCSSWPQSRGFYKRDLITFSIGIMNVIIL